MRDPAQALYEEVDKYRQTLNVTLLFGHELVWDNTTHGKVPGSNFWSGKPMIVQSGPDRGKTVTPDLIAFVRQNQGTIGEIKHGLPQDASLWKRAMQQINKYDAELGNWSNTCSGMPAHDIILLIPNYMRVRFEDYYNDPSNADLFLFSNRFSAVSYVMEQNAKLFLTLERFIGSLSDSKKDALLRGILRIPVERVLPKYPMQFCNQDPPLPYTMSVVWNHIGAYIATDEEGKKIIRFSLDDVLRDLRRLNYFGGEEPGGPELPKRTWIYKALEMLKKLRAISQVGKCEYELSHQKWRRVKTPLPHFIEKLSKASAVTKPVGPIIEMLA